MVKIIESFEARERTILVTATYTAEPVRESLEFWLKQMQWPWTIKFSAYNQVFQQLLDTESALSINKQGVNIMLVRFEDWIKGSSNKMSTEINSVTKNVDELIEAIQIASRRFTSPLILCLCRASPMIGNDDLEKQLYQQMEKRLQSGLRHIPGVYVIGSDEIEQNYPVEDYYDGHSNELGHIPYTSLYYTALGTILARKVHSLQATPVKVIVLDCDQTLWKGICGEVEPLGVEVDSACELLQNFVLTQYRSGKLICLCSKNNEDDVWEVFDHHPGLVLQREHIAAWRINWQPKSENIRSLAQELNLGLESFVFIDDDSMECAEVQASCPEVITLQLPKDDGNVSQFLRNLWVCDQVSLTEEDQKRSVLYQENVKREQYRKHSLTLGKFIAGLELKIKISPMEPQNINRVAQLTQRTNQFNMSNRRWNESEIQQFSQSGTYVCLAIEVSDRFGSYGLVGAVFYTIESDVLRVVNFLLSCRVLGRGAEHQILAKVGEISIGQGLEWVELDYISTSKNQPALEFLERIGVENKRSLGEMEVYRMRSIHTVSVSYQPEKEGVENLEPGSLEQLQTRNFGTTKRYEERSRLINRIAREWNNAEIILKTIEAQKRQRLGLEDEMISPRTTTEEVLANIWAQVLHLESVSIHDNFFQLGGDSLLGIRVITLANKVNIHLSPSQIQEYPTIAQLASSASAKRTIDVDQGLITGPTLLTISQHDLINSKFQNPHHMNIACLYEVHKRLKPDLLEQAFQAVITHHDALRTRFRKEGSRWQAFIEAPKESCPISFFDISKKSVIEQRKTIEKNINKMQRSLNLFDGPLIRVAYFFLGEQQPGRLFIIVHHQIFDEYSLEILVNDLLVSYEQFTRGEKCQLPLKTTSVKEWTERLNAYAQSNELRKEMEYWLDLPWKQVHALPRKHKDQSDDENSLPKVNSQSIDYLIANDQYLSMSLTREETDILIKSVPQAYGVQVMDALLMAYVHALTAKSGGYWHPIHVMNAGRSEIFSIQNVDLTRTIGHLNVWGLCMLHYTETNSIIKALIDMSKQRQNIPNQGVGYFALRYLSNNKKITKQLKSLLKEDIQFNYIGQENPINSGNGLLNPASENMGNPMSAMSPYRQVPKILYCTANVQKNQLIVTMKSEYLKVKPLIQDYIEKLQEIISYYQSNS